jgi:hypothetical protein
MTMHIFARMTKVDEAARTVTGVIANEALDRSGEVFDYESSKPLFEKWSAGVAKATDGKSVGNVRVMHSPSVAGVVKQMDMDDDAKAISVCAKIVDDNEWNKVLAGCYTGFSIGGSYARKWKGDDGLQRYTADPAEVSIVDLPCNPDAQFSVIKSDGAEELRKFATIAVTEPVEKAAGHHALLDACEAGTSDDDNDALDALDDARDAVGSDDEVGKGAAGDFAAERANDATRATLGDGSTKAAHEHAASKHARAARHASRAGATKRAAYHKAMSAFHGHRAAGCKKSDEPGDLAKVADDLTKAHDALQKVTGERDELAKQLETVTGEYTALMAKAAQPKGVVKVIPVSKDADADHDTLNKLDDSPVLQKDGSVNHEATALKLMKLAHRR